ncbi:hypothetical protein TSAR_001117 [Trichomalopsis sarcophagae]|uniref:Uncharacterized protein n=1 Tax=Trichomalopsis sarcophagae TaxID=543379 RepID=A0A232ESR8_9HYME|nr:hypothetical protein TSAR_001117 [Trichomalopsis sarcophagae]
MNFLKRKAAIICTTYKLLDYCLTPENMTNYTFYRVKDKKKKFSALTLCSCIFLAVEAAFPVTATEDAVKKSIKLRLDTSTTRFKRSSQAPAKRAKFMPVVPNFDDTEYE